LVNLSSILSAILLGSLEGLGGFLPGFLS
jgi:hypothetical protein